MSVKICEDCGRKADSTVNHYCPECGGKLVWE